MSRRALQTPALVLDESFVTAGTSHNSMEPRSAMAYWQNGKCYLYGSTQSQSYVIPALAALLQIEPEGPRLCLGVLWWWVRVEGARLPRYSHSGLYGKEGPAGRC